ncbi:3'(2'),5'-bisphosphate nucleotidase CysQ family protein [Draconibacterium halophilum]|uniref:3'(2'),5-bisphosphonucleoside 3'(2')-phosphohydrolase n=1 Tax=Draconibacterium halophilum TaxID=2706887 RepID=A0A6C0R849_9BACT|nr:3'(2'),5'-bisphosphate nucleotidase CysQ [Draconibacterium halophilum]QIA06390.1 3'(2'),5'-bisphosphate nucleotidase CysQ [Draconibacterium halophilum]
MDLNKVYSVIDVLAKAGKAIIEVYESNDFDEQRKSDNTAVTRADKASSKIINEGLAEIFPDNPVLDEEINFPEYTIRKTWENYFLVDPLDGTKEFIKRNGEFCINIALINKTAPVNGWIYEPLKEKGWYCGKGDGVFEFDNTGNFVKIEKPGAYNGKIRVATSRSFFKPREAELIKKMKRNFELEILHCGSSKKQIEIIKGNADMYLKAGPCSEWDTAPGQLMVEEFGGTVFRQDNFETMAYNKADLINPYFIMLNERLNTPNLLLLCNK